MPARTDPLVLDTVARRSADPRLTWLAAARAALLATDGDLMLTDRLATTATQEQARRGRIEYAAALLAAQTAAPPVPPVTQPDEQHPPRQAQSRYARKPESEPDEDEDEEDPAELPEWAAALADSASPEALRWVEARLYIALAGTGGGPTGTIARAILEVRGAREARGAATDGVDPLLDEDPRRALAELARLGREAEAVLGGSGRSPAQEAPARTDLPSADGESDQGDGAPDGGDSSGAGDSS